MLGGARVAADLGDELAPGLFTREVEHFVECEWAATADDVLWRRTKLGLVADVRQQEAVAATVQARTKIKNVIKSRDLTISAAALSVMGR